MSWHPPVPPSVRDEEGTQWLVRRAWPEPIAGDYAMELAAPARPGVRAAHLRAGRVELLPAGGDRRLPDLARVEPLGEVVVHRAHKRAVVRAGDHYFKIFRPRQSDEAADRHTRASAFLAAGDFVSPEVIWYTQGCLLLTALPGRSLFELGSGAALSDVGFEEIWQKWSRAWVRQLTLAGTAAHSPPEAPASLARRTAAVELDNLQRMVDLWLLHAGDIPAARAQRDAVRAAAAQTAAQLLRTPPDPLVWSHGDLHDKQIFATAPGAPLGLLDFDEAGLAEAAADLANLAAHLDLRLRQGRLTDERYLAARRQVTAAAVELRVTPARFGAYAAAAKLRLGCLYSFRPQWAGLAADLLREAADSAGPAAAAG
ncbi:hypothetical protein E7Y32_07050 [Arthrobacter sp. UKPF54-2]|uniref:phosphotransferase n=1 Tax=Arthrobacter sp. UKPF54-2 TaxID=2600159 RepID=UPI0011B18F7D|nr:phosphotransferase [Arthrobacter sp. UKPF54-2]QDY89993.1 hypothetical protein E7Y32_07050 [Arthrobacter sp. UKPF54-2]